MRIRSLKLVTVLAIVIASASAPWAARVSAVPAPEATFQSIGPLAFAPSGGVLFAADRQAATIVALEIGTATTGAPGTMNVPGIDQKIAGLLGTDVSQIAITDLAVHPQTRQTYLSVMRGQGATGQAALVRIDGAGKLETVSLAGVKFTTVALPNPAAVSTTGRNNRMQSVTDMALFDGRLYVTGLSNEEFASKFWAVPYPFKTADNGTSVEIYHGNHGAFETRAPILTFVPTSVANQPTLIAGYTCTPLVKFPVSDLKPGAKVMGTTIAEFGAGNTPIDMVLYKKDGREFMLLSNTRHGVLKIATEPFATASPITARVGGTAGVPFERIAAMVNVLQLDVLDATRSIVISRSESGALNLEAVILP